MLRKCKTDNYPGINLDLWLIRPALLLIILVKNSLSFNLSPRFFSYSKIVLGPGIGLGAYSQAICDSCANNKTTFASNFIQIGISI